MRGTFWIEGEEENKTKIHVWREIQRYVQDRERHREKNIQLFWRKESNSWSSSSFVYFFGGELQWKKKDVKSCRRSRGPMNNQISYRLLVRPPPRPPRAPPRPPRADCPRLLFDWPLPVFCVLLRKLLPPDLLLLLFNFGREVFCWITLGLPSLEAIEAFTIFETFGAIAIGRPKQREGERE